MWNCSPYLRVALDHRVHGPFELRPRIIFDYELLYLEKGSLIVEIAGSPVRTIQAGTLLLFRPGRQHALRTLMDAGETWMPHIHFDAQHFTDAPDVPVCFKTRDACSEAELAWIRPDLLADQPFQIPDIIDIADHAAVLALIRALVPYHGRQDQSAILASQALILQILAVLLRGLAQQQDPQLSYCRDRLEQAADRIRRDCRRNWSIAELALGCSMSTASFNRLFHRQYGLPPRQYILRQRNIRACELLQYTAMNLSEIAAEVGYGSIQAFRRAFRKQQQLYPAEFRSRAFHKDLK